MNFKKSGLCLAMFVVLVSVFFFSGCRSQSRQITFSISQISIGTNTITGNYHVNALSIGLLSSNPNLQNRTIFQIASTTNFPVVCSAYPTGVLFFDDVTQAVFSRSTLPHVQFSPFVLGDEDYVQFEFVIAIGLNALCQLRSNIRYTSQKFNASELSLSNRFNFDNFSNEYNLSFYMDLLLINI